jgi:hypothetical protein
MAAQHLSWARPRFCVVQGLAPNFDFEKKACFS